MILDGLNYPSVGQPRSLSVMAYTRYSAAARPRRWSRSLLHPVPGSGGRSR